jgi:copper chaperone CopZ
MRIPVWIVPALVVAAIGAGLGGAQVFTAPSYTRVYAAGPAPHGGPEPVTSKLTVRGLRCVDTARTMSSLLDDVPGVIRCECFASRNEARVTYDPALVSAPDIRQALEGPVFDSTSFRFDYGLFEVVRIDGRKADPVTVD